MFLRFSLIHKLIFSVLIGFVLMSCQSNKAPFDRRYNGWVPLAKAFGPKRFKEAYDHTLLKMERNSSDCQPDCPRIDAWKYLYKDSNGKLIESSKPISTKKKHWKVEEEARVIAFSLFGDKPEYLDGLLDYIESFSYIKEVNGIKEKNWGYESFTIRVYSPKRRPDRVKKMGVLKGELSEAYINKLLDLGGEVVYVDNLREKTVRDASFWRFLILDEPLEEGEKLRFLLRDADWILTTAELFTIGEWIISGLRFHRMHLIPICVGPLTASWWGGVYTKEDAFKDILHQMEYYPYRLFYGDDEVFLRDLVWPKILASGSVLTHLYPRKTLSYFAMPYKGSCGEPTQEYCDAIKKGGNCKDLLMPKDFPYAAVDLGVRTPFKELKKRQELFVFERGGQRVENVLCALSPSCWKKRGNIIRRSSLP